MRGKWWFILLGASLALNVGVLGMFLARRVGEHNRGRWMERNWGSGPSRRFREMFEEHRPQMDSLHRQEMLTRRELGGFIEQEELDSAEVERWLVEMSRLNEERNRVALATTREFYWSLEPELRERFLKRARRMFDGPHPRTRRHGRRPGRPGRRRGRGHGRGDRPGFPPDGGPPEAPPPTEDPFGGE